MSRRNERHHHSAAHDGRLERIDGVGARRAAAIRAFLSDRLGRRRLTAGVRAKRPSVAVLLALDALYRDKAQAEILQTIAPRRFNPSGEQWLPVWRQSRGPWRFTVLFSNTARAHALAKTHDWVVIFFHSDGAPEGQSTIVTETRGPAKGKRVVRGRESECVAHYRALADAPQRN